MATCINWKYFITIFFHFILPACIIIKSTISLEGWRKDIQPQGKEVTFSPEFLTAANANEDFKNPPFQVFGGKWKDCEVVEKAYLRHSSVKIVPTFKVDLTTASLLKYSINSWLATKVMFFNELKTLHELGTSMVSWEQFTDMLSRDERIGKTHMQVPGPDGKAGFGGHCFPKDTEALLNYANKKNIKMSVLRKLRKHKYSHPTSKPHHKYNPENNTHHNQQTKKKK